MKENLSILAVLSRKEEPELSRSLPIINYSPYPLLLPIPLSFHSALGSSPPLNFPSPKTPSLFCCRLSPSLTPRPLPSHPLENRGKSIRYFAEHFPVVQRHAATSTVQFAILPGALATTSNFHAKPTLQWRGVGHTVRSM